MSKEYKSIVGGALKLKGGLSLSKPKKEKKEKKRKREKREDEDEVEEKLVEQEEEYVPVLQLGEGRIISSGTTITGTGTNFMLHLTAGDALLIQHPYTLEQETRIITMVLSDVSIGISSPFSSDLVAGIKFEYIKKPKSKEVKSSDEIGGVKRAKKNEVDMGAFGTYADHGGETLTYRVKNPGVYGTYKIVTEKVGGTGSKTRNDLLTERCKKKADRMCM